MLSLPMHSACALPTGSAHVLRPCALCPRALAAHALCSSPGEELDPDSLVAVTDDDDLEVRVAGGARMERMLHG